jgi:hypothetical protein
LYHKSESEQGKDLMKLAFVVRLGTDSRPSEGKFEGWVEEVDTCIERRFHSTPELLAFLGECFDKIAPNHPANGVSKRVKNCRKKNRAHNSEL